MSTIFGLQTVDPSFTDADDEFHPVKFCVSIHAMPVWFPGSSIQSLS